MAEPLTLDPEQKKKIAARAIIVAFGIGAVGVMLSTGLLVLGATRVALGILAGHLLAFVLGLSWIVGAVGNWDGPSGRLIKSTLGFAPVRLIVVVAALWAAVALGAAWIEPAAMVLTFAVTQLCLHVAQADTFWRLADASKKRK